MASPTLKQLRYFESLAKHRHFGHAADACAITQPALSVQIRDLEAILGMKLFERGARSVRLSGFGEEMAPRVRDILCAVDELADLSRAAREGLTGRLRLGVIPTVAPYLLPVVLRSLDDTYPGLELYVRETRTGRLIRELTEGRLDAAIVALPTSETAFEEVALFSEPFVLIRTAAQADQPVPSQDALQSMRLLLLEEGHCFRDQALSFCKMPSARPRDGLDGSSLSTLVQMVGAGLGVTLIPEMAVPVETGAAPVSVARFGEPQPRRTIGMIWRKTSPLADRLRTVSETVGKAAASPRDRREDHPQRAGPRAKR